MFEEYIDDLPYAGNVLIGVPESQETFYGHALICLLLTGFSFAALQAGPVSVRILRCTFELFDPGGKGRYFSVQLLNVIPCGDIHLLKGLADKFRYAPA